MDGRELVAAYFDNTLTPGQAEELAAWLAQSPEHARYFAEWSVLEDQIGEQYGVAGVLRAEQRSLSVSSGVRERRLRPWLFAAAAVVLVSSLVVVLSNLGRPAGPPAITDQRAPATDQESVGRVEVATLVDQRDAVWASSDTDTDWAHTHAPGRGDRILAGPAQLVSGVVHLRTDSGADLILEGPTRFVIEDPHSLRLESGRVYGDASASGKSFALKSDRVDLTGCDRSFAMSVGDDALVLCQVYAGAGDAHVRNASGGTEHVSRLLPNQSLTVDADGRVRLGRVDTSAVVRTLEVSELGVGRDYVQAVRASGPTDYWRFEHLDGGDLYNDIPGRPSLRVQSVGGGLGLSDDIQNRHLLRSEVTGEFLVSTEKLTVNADRYSLECWVRNDHADAWTTLFAFQVFPEVRTELEFGLIQLEMLPAVEGDASAGHRFMLTHADRAGDFPRALVSQPDRDAASWHHIVVVRDGSRISLFRDGERWATAQAHMAGMSMDAILVVGRNGVTPGGSYRLFRGSLDEVALYDRALSASEVRRHYNAMDQLPVGGAGER